MFSKEFLFGASLSGFQFEMGENKKDIDENTDWFVWVRDFENLINGNVSGDLPENGAGYMSNYPQIHQLAQDFCFNLLRIGIEWSRVFPDSTQNIQFGSEDMLEKLDKIANREAVEKYRDIILDLKMRGFTVIVNLNHFTLPLWIHDPILVHKGRETEKIGWANENISIEFAKFAEYIAWKFNDIVDYWSSLNEPNIVSQLGYLNINAGFPPSYFSIDWFNKSLINQAKAHNLAYDVIKKHTNKPVGIIYSFSWIDVLKENKEIFEKAMYFENWYFMDMVKDKVDFIGVNYYTRKVVEEFIPYNLGNLKITWQILPGYGYSCSEKGLSLDGRPASDFGWEIYPVGLYNILEAIFERYEKPIIVTENGIADEEDKLRPQYLISHLYAVEKSINKGIKIFGYLHWSIIDNFEWAKGYSKRFGLVYTDFAKKAYIPKPSMYIYKEIIKERSTEKFISFDPYNIINF